MDDLIDISKKDIIGQNNQTPIYKYSQLPSDYAYARIPKIIKINCHLGQRKLLLNEIQFYSNYVAGTEKQLIIYAGSAPGQHTPTILSMFPNIKLLLIDPNYHMINADVQYVYQNPNAISTINRAVTRRTLKCRTGDPRQSYLGRAVRQLQQMPFMHHANPINVLCSSPADTDAIHENRTAFTESRYKTLISDIMEDDGRVFIIQDYLTIKLTQLIAESLKAYTQSPIYFITDIRTNMFGSDPTDLDYLWNYALQIAYLNILQPAYSMLKFHPPYFEVNDKSIDLLTDEKENSSIITEIKYDLNYVHEHFNYNLIANHKRGEFYYIPNNEIFTQPWGPGGTSEARLIVAADNIGQPAIEYPHGEWENKFYYLRYMRMYGYFGVFYDKLKTFKGVMPYDACADCCLEILILGSYLLNSSRHMHLDTIDVDAVKDALDSECFVNDLLNLTNDIDGTTFYGIKYNRKCPTHGNLKNVPNDVNIYTLLTIRKNKKEYNRLTISPNGETDQRFGVNVVYGKNKYFGNALFTSSSNNNINKKYIKMHVRDIF